MSKTVFLRARRPFAYNHRRLNPGDDFEAPRLHAKILIGTKKAYAVRSPVELAPPPPALVEQVAAPPSLADLRSEYETVLGKRPFMGWDAAELRRRITAGPDA